jgi:predicted Holliday junction resolvase-like endonuclease
MVLVLVVLLVMAVLVIVRLAVSKASYQARYKHTDADVRSARDDSLMRSRSVVNGRVQEHLAPLFPEFIQQFNPRDAIFLGTPLDFVVFDGLNDRDDPEVRRVVFVEVKTGKASPSRRERRVRDAIQAGRVEYQLLRLPNAIAEAIPPADEMLSRPAAASPRQSSET